MHTACFVRDHSIPAKVNTPKAILIIIMEIVVNVMSDHTHLSPIIHVFDGSILWLVRERKIQYLQSLYVLLV